MIIVRVNDKVGNNVAECVLHHQDTGIWYVHNKTNISNVYGDIEQIESEFEDYAETIDIDIENLIPPKKMDLIKSLVGAWTTFEVLRSEYVLNTSSDFEYVVDILHKPLLYGFITEEEYSSYIEAIKDFFGCEGESYDMMFTNNEYTYEELDNFIHQLNPIYIV